MAWPGALLGGDVDWLEAVCSRGHGAGGKDLLYRCRPWGGGRHGPRQGVPGCQGEVWRRRWKSELLERRPDSGRGCCGHGSHGRHNLMAAEKGGTRR